MKQEGRVEKKKKRATRRKREAQLNQIISGDDYLVGSKRKKLSHDDSFVYTPKANDFTSLQTGSLRIIPGSPELVQ